MNDFVFYSGAKIGILACTVYVYGPKTLIIPSVRGFATVSSEDLLGMGVSTAKRDKGHIMDST